MIRTRFIRKNDQSFFGEVFDDLPQIWVTREFPKDEGLLNNHPELFNYKEVHYSREIRWLPEGPMVTPREWDPVKQPRRWDVCYREC